MNKNINKNNNLQNIAVNPEWAKLPLFDHKGWQRLPFGAFAESVNERVDPGEAADEIYVGLEHLDPQDLHIRRWGKGSDVIGTKLRFRKSDLIFGRRRAYQRKLAVAEFDGICSAHAMVVRAKPKLVLPEFLPFLMMSDRFMKRAVEISVGSLSPTINWKTLKLEEFDLPPLDQQRRIAEILWSIDNDIEQKISLEQATRNLANCSRDEHFSNKDHKLTSIQNTAKWVSGNTPSRSKKEFWVGSFPWISPKDMKRDLILDSEEHLSKSGQKEATVVDADSLLIVIRGMILAHSFPIGITQRDVAFNQDMKALVPTENFSVNYLFHWFRWATPNILRRISDSSHGTKRLAMPDLYEMMIPVIPFKQQETFIQKIEAIETSAQNALKNVASLSTLRTEILSRIFRE